MYKEVDGVAMGSPIGLILAETFIDDGTGAIGWQNSALDRRKFYDIKFFNFVRPQSGHIENEIL